MRSDSVIFKLFQAVVIIWTIAWAVGNLSWVAASSPYCFGESSILKLYAYTAFQQGNCQEILHAPALFTFARPFIALGDCQPYIFAIIQTIIFLIYASLAAYIATYLYGTKTGWLSFLLLTFSLGALQNVRTFLLDYPLAIPLLLLYVFYLKSANFKKKLPCLLFSGALWLGAQTKYSFLPIWAAPLCLFLWGHNLYRALHSDKDNVVHRLDRAWKDDNGRSLTACLISQISLFALALAALSYQNHFPNSNVLYLTYWRLGAVWAILAAITAFCFTTARTLHPAWQRFYRCWASCCLGLSLSAWSYTSSLEAVSSHTAANFNQGAWSWSSLLSNIPAAWLSYFSTACQGDLLPFPWAFLAFSGLLISYIKRQDRQRSVILTTALMVSVLLQIMPWDHAYQRFFAPLLPWLAILAARFLLEMGNGKQWRVYFCAALVLIMWLEAAAFSLAWAWPLLSNHLPKLQPTQLLGEGLSLNVPRHSRTLLINLRESVHPWHPPTNSPKLIFRANPFYPTFFTIQPLRQPWFDELTAICSQLATLNNQADTQNIQPLIIIAELNGHELKGEGPAMELRLWCANQKLSPTLIPIIGVNHPSAYQSAAIKKPNNLTVLISDAIGPSSKLQQDLHPWLDSRRFRKQSSYKDSGLNLFYYSNDSFSRTLFPESQKNF